MSDDRSAEINASGRDGWLTAMGLVLTWATANEVRCEWEVGPQHLQAYGIVHGGVYCGVIETITSIGAHLSASERGQRTVGLENHTSFVRAVRSGRLFGHARPVTRGRTSQLWEAFVHDVDGQLVARGTVRLACVPADHPLGAPPTAKSSVS